MGNKVNIIEEIRDRIETAITGGTLIAKRVRVGALEEIRKENDLPIINIQLLGGDEEANFRNQRYTDNMRFQISLVHSKLAATNNTLYKTSDSTGVLFELEKLLNVLDKNTSGTVDANFNSTANNLRSYTYEVEEDAGFVVVNLLVTVDSKIFQAGGR